MAELVDVEIEFLDPAGDGVARHRGATLIVPFTIPGERVRVRVGPSRGGVIAAALDSVLRPSPHRVAPYCPHFGPAFATASARPRRSASRGGGAGRGTGCRSVRRMYLAAHRLSRATPAENRAGDAPDSEGRAEGARGTVDVARRARRVPLGYRHKVHFVFGEAGRTGRRQGALVMGHYVRGSRRIIPIRECPVHDDRGNALAFRLRDAFARANISAGPQDGRRPALKSIAIRVGHGSPDVMATLVLTSEADKRLRTATRRVIDGPAAPSSFHVNVHPTGDAFIFGRETRKITGPERMRDEVAGVSFLISPTAFFQTNVHAAELLVRLVLEAVPGQARVLDLYAGAGLFALPLAKAGHHVVAVEEDPAAVADGEASLRLNRIPAERCEFVARRVEQVLESPSGRTRFDVVVLDPPREGCSPAVVDRIFAGLAPRAAVYISCNPEALARDLAAIVRHGYRVRSLQPVDMFPHTAHVETVALLGR